MNSTDSPESVRYPSDASGWPGESEEIVAAARATGLQCLIVLDVAAVGVGAGVPTEALCQKLRTRFPELRLITGGGVRNVADLRRLERLGVEGVLVASAATEVPELSARADLVLPGPAAVVGLLAALAAALV